MTNTASISEEIHVTTSPEVSLPKTIDEISKDVGPCNFAEFVSSIKMTPEQQKLLINKTKDQSMSNIWFEQRKDRINASILKSAAIKVEDNTKLINRDKSRTILSKVCGYYPRPKSKATNWGISNEPGATNTYVKRMKKKHQNFKVEETGFYVHVEHPYIGASPGGFVECDCHSPGLLEIKCPWSHQNLTVSKYSAMNRSCLYLDDNVIHLIKTHEYFYQVQCQMFVRKRNYCAFFVLTIKVSFCERITYDTQFMRSMVQKVDILYKQLILPEIFSRELKNTLFIEKQVKLTLNHLVTTVCEQEKENIDPDLFYFDLDFTIGL